MICVLRGNKEGERDKEGYRRRGSHLMLDGQGSVTDKILLKQRPEGHGERAG